MKILLTRSLLEKDKKYITDALSAHIKDQYKIVEPEVFNEDGLCKVIQDADVLLGPFITKKMIERAINLKLIQIPWTGVDTFNFGALNDSTITVCNSHSNASAVAELGVGLVLDLVKKISYHDRKLRKGQWNRDQQPLSLSSGMINNQTVCILGYGNIGRYMGKLLKAFGSKIIAVDTTNNAYPEVDTIYESANWIEALEQADICVCSLPLTSQTKGLINAEALGKMKKGSLLVNLSRADIIVEKELYQALTDGTIAGFASDVWWNSPQRGESESYVSTHYNFGDLENVILSPHRAGFVEGTLPHLDDAITNIINLAEGRPLINVVDVNAKY